ncbi:hypothetical protein Halru_2687 [Halovivax ruber XH-70]|uniref:DUF6760 domain-containing protein n=1 Tax=Halovivax ruber (strain DSM 18193 / JCM 13892 / XH-70) TaxID=797302 RepID=L0IH05_HALRX|nr:DUF6760 family protein [Halovivax ruber]AGB17262.1 hypothetical protein Halru_2687 [Halovivax ruber XH-70]
MTGVVDPEDLFAEVAFVAYHFGWSHEEVLSLPHWERRRWCAEISEINERMNEPTELAEPTDRGSSESTQGSFIDGDGEGIILQNSFDAE